MRYSGRVLTARAAELRPLGRSITHGVEMSNSVILRSELTCPRCGLVREESMPTDACMFFYECTGCHVVLRPKAGDCCVFCSFGSVKCPPMQQSSQCCSPLA